MEKDSLFKALNPIERKQSIYRINIAVLIFLFWIFGLFIFIESSEAQTKKTNDIKGAIVDENSGEALPYANILLKGTRLGTSSNTDGYFILVNAPARPCTLVVIYIGYATKEVVVDNKTEKAEPLKISLKAVVLEQEGVTVVAENYVMWKPAEEVGQVTFSPARISALPSVGEADIFRSLQLLPGISGVSDGSAGLYIRGGTPDQNLVMLDGMTVYHVDHFFGFFSAFNADAVKDVQVYKGGYPAKFGGRLSSVVELTGKTGSVNKKQLGFGINLLSANVVAELPLFGGKGSWILSARRSYTDLVESELYNKLFDSITDGEATTTTQFGGGFGGRGIQQQETRPDFYFYDVNSKLSFVPSLKDIFALSFYNGKDNMHDLQDLGGLQFGGLDSLVNGTRGRDETTDWGNLGMSLKWAHRWHGRFNSNFLIAGSSYFSDHTTDLSFTTEDNDTSRVFGGRGNFASQEDNEITDLTFRLDNEWHLNSSHLVEFGVGLTRTKTDYAATINDTVSVFDSRETSQQASFYLQSKKTLFNRLVLSTGLRGVYYGQTESFYLEPRASLQYSLSDRLKVKGATGLYNQFIHRIINEDVLEGSRDFWLVADENLMPSSAQHYILGLEYETPGFLFEVEGYHKDMDNLLEFSRRFQNQADFGGLFFFGSGFSRGIEFLAQKKRGAFSGWASYTLGEIEYTFPNLNNGEPFPASHERTHEVKLVGIYSLGRWNFASTWVFASGQPYTSPVGQYSIELLDGSETSYIHVGGKNANYLPDYHRMDFSVSYKLALKKEHNWDAEVGLSLFNLYDHNNVWYRKYDLEVSPIVVSDVSMLGLTPTLYLKAKL